ncbi:MAG: hypothetical protein ACKVOR_02475 [Flavobacteriales bacterium]
MRKTQIIKSAIAVLLAVVTLAGCQSAADKEKDAQQKVKSAQDDLAVKQAKADAELKEAREKDEWLLLQKDAELQVKTNELAIMELKVKMKKSGKTMDTVYSNRIDGLEASNVELRDRIKNYKREQSDWEAFKREWRNDMDALSKDIRNLMVDNTK